MQTPETRPAQRRFFLPNRIAFITLASFIGTELLTGSTPVFPQALLSPVNVILLCLYGGGALLVREIAVMYKKGWFSILAFGAAYAIIEEGIALKTWFVADPNFAYGRLMSVNWSFGLAETIVEALFSIVLPIMLTRVAFRGSQSERWLGRKGLIITSVVFVIAVSMLFHATFSRFTDIGTQLPLALAMTLGFVLLGFAIRSPEKQQRRKISAASSMVLALLYLISTLLVFAFAPVWLTPSTPHPLPPFFSAAAAAVVLTAAFAYLHRALFSERQLLAIVSGVAGAMFLVSIFGPQRALGAPIGVVLYLLVLLYAWRRMRREESASQSIAA